MSKIATRCKLTSNKNCVNPCREVGVVIMRTSDASRIGRESRNNSIKARADLLYPVSSSVENRFFNLLNTWKNETKYSSSITQILKHPALKSIIEMGQAAIPLILEDLKREQSFLYEVLYSLSGADPVQPEHQGNVEEIINDWITWGRGEKYIE